MPVFSKVPAPAQPTAFTVNTILSSAKVAWAALTLAITLAAIAPSARADVTSGITDPAASGNFVWPNATIIPLNDVAGVLQGSAQQAITQFDQSAWFKFRVQPGSRVVVTLGNLFVNFDLVLFRDIARSYQALTSAQDLPQLDAEFADDAFSPAQFSPAQFSPAQFSPAAFSPAQFSPAQFSPAQFSPAQFSPAQFSPAQFSPDAFAPAQFSPAQFSPAQFSPAQFSPAQFSPAQFSPAQFSEAAYASAQVRSVIGVSAFDGRADEGLVANTWNDDSWYYVRVRGRQGAFDAAHPFLLSVYLFTGLCANLHPVPQHSDGTPLPPSTFAAPANGYRTLILADLDRLLAAHPNASRNEIETRLAALAARPEVQGCVLNVAADPWVAYFNTQADASRSCPYAKNLAADAIREIIQRSRTGNSLEYVVLVGGDDVIPFFREPDEAMLGPEIDFVPPVREFTASQASLRQNFVLTQERYGACREVVRKGARVPVPDLAIGRLVETPDEINGLLDAYLGTASGIVATPTSALVTGYDFLADAAEAVAVELSTGLGLPADRLIAPMGLAPTDPESWTAQDLRAALLAHRHDITFLAGHFSAAATLAADFSTRFLAAELLASPIDFTNALLFSAGCHSGYNIVDADAVQQVTMQPDWAQVCARKRMTLVAGTGYQYGDTDFLEYGERLYLGFARQLRTGPGPIAVGAALARAKREYLANTADLRGIHQKTLLEATLFGLPMLRFDLPGARLPVPAANTIVAGTSGYSSVPPTPGQVLGLRYADISLHPTLTPHQQTLRNAEDDPADPNDPAQVTAVWFSGRDGVAVNPAEPVLPLELYPVGLPNYALRGVGFRGGDYLDLDNVTILTGAATTEIRGVHPAFLSPEFFPSKFWRVNYFGELCGQGEAGTRLALTPAQFRNATLGDQGQLRRYTRTDFRLFYSGNRETYLNPQANTSSTPALSSPPSIVRCLATSTGNTIRFRIQVTGNPAAGIQGVWVTYTAVTGPLYGHWTSLDLVQNTSDTRLWEANLTLNGTTPESLRFMVQAVNGVGLVALASNLGATFIPNQTEPPTTAQTATALNLVNPPASGVYGSRPTFSARLTKQGVPLAQRVIAFDLGGLTVQALTDADGVATARFNLLITPGAKVIRARFLGTSDLGASTAQAAFEVLRSPTTLTLSPNPARVSPLEESALVATVTDGVGRPILDQTIVFVATGPAGTKVAVESTDFNGRARLAASGLPGGTYTVTASFAQAVTPPPPYSSVGGPSDLYAPSTTTADLVVDPDVPLAVDDLAVGLAGQPLKIPIAALFANDSNPAGGTLTLANLDAFTGRGVTVTRSGAWLVLSGLTEASAADAFRYTLADTAGRQSTARVVVRSQPDAAPTSNLLDVTLEQGGIRIRFAGIPGRTYDVQYTVSLQSPDWQTLGSARVGADGIGEFLAPIFNTQGFFRTAHP